MALNDYSLYRPPTPAAQPKKRKKSRSKLSKIRRENASNQARNSAGRFARFGGYLDRLFSKKKRRLRPVYERSFFGKVKALFNGDFTRWRRRAARRNSEILRRK